MTMRTDDTNFSLTQLFVQITILSFLEHSSVLRGIAIFLNKSNFWEYAKPKFLLLKLTGAGIFPNVFLMICDSVS